MLVNAGADVNDADARGVSVMVLAAHSGFGDLVEFLLDEGADPNAAEAGFSALHVAIMRRDEDMGRRLLARGADPNARLTNWTPSRAARRLIGAFHPCPDRSDTVSGSRLGSANPGSCAFSRSNGADPFFVHEVHYVAVLRVVRSYGGTEEKPPRLSWRQSGWVDH